MLSDDEEESGAGARGYPIYMHLEQTAEASDSREKHLLHDGDVTPLQDADDRQTRTAYYNFAAEKSLRAH